ncbi:hypothetical protein RX398_05080 [Collinsella aerofaciens]|uniref:hypothetical protein n=1 Tax=Collinsella aerofaciens TaxID=74426 RepID=UPI002915B330|nr:hypothetical protein [Collinsella aerofaciens]MDU8576754.1 hypothetical protein [Collinsella aerofaciens]
MVEARKHIAADGICRVFRAVLTDNGAEFAGEDRGETGADVSGYRPNVRTAYCRRCRAAHRLPVPTMVMGGMAEAASLSVRNGLPRLKSQRTPAAV